MFTIQEVSRRTAIAAATLRTWERRYGVPSPGRTPGGYRSYSAEDLTAIDCMKELLSQGIHPQEAAAIVLHGGGLATATPDTFLKTVIQTGNRADLDHELALRMNLDRLEEFADQWLMPTLTLMGEQWCGEGLPLAIEHEVSAAIMRRLGVLWQSRPPGKQQPTVCVGLPGGGRHEIGVLLFAVLLRREGYDVRYLGPDLPAAGWTDVVGGSRPCLVVTAVHRSEEIEAADDLIRAVRGAGAGAVALGGRYQDATTQAAIRLGHRFTEALARMRMLAA